MSSVCLLQCSKENGMALWPNQIKHRRTNLTNKTLRHGGGSHPMNLCMTGCPGSKRSTFLCWIQLRAVCTQLLYYCMHPIHKKKICQQFACARHIGHLASTWFFSLEPSPRGHMPTARVLLTNRVSWTSRTIFRPWLLDTINARTKPIGFAYRVVTTFFFGFESNPARCRRVRRWSWTCNHCVLNRRWRRKRRTPRGRNGHFTSTWLMVLRTAVAAPFAMLHGELRASNRRVLADCPIKKRCACTHEVSTLTMRAPLSFLPWNFASRRHMIAAAVFFAHRVRQTSRTIVLPWLHDPINSRAFPSSRAQRVVLTFIIWFKGYLTEHAP